MGYGFTRSCRVARGIAGNAKESSAWRVRAEKTRETKPPDLSAQIEAL
jgi:hypothetical protein